MCLVQSQPAPAAGPWQIPPGLSKRMHIAHLKAAYGTAGMAALQLPKSIVHLMFMSRISNQANSHKENMPRALQHRAHADAAAGQSSEKENVQGQTSWCSQPGR
ncbi:TPA: hypothetical protein ACH3X3_001291 [Trebouxia sp. C0006]